MKPFFPEWASNNTYAGGADAGSNTKQEQDAAHATDGFVKGGKVEPDKWNLWRYRIAESLNNAASIGPRTTLRTLKDPSAGGYTVPAAYGASSIVQDHAFGVFDPSDPRHVHTFCLTETPNFGAANYFEVNAQGQYAWMDSITSGGSFPIALPGGGGDILNGIAVDTSSGRALACDSGGSGLYTSTSYGAWAAWATTGGYDCYGILHDQSDGNWIAIRASGGNHYALRASSLGGVLTTQNLGAYTTITGALAHTRHEADDLYPGSLSNSRFMWIDSGGGLKKITAVNDPGTWSTFTGTTAGYTLQPEDTGCLAYSRWSETEGTKGRWGMIVPTGTATTNQTFVYSDDNGENWTEITDAFGFDTNPLDVSKRDFHLCCDGWGTWMACAAVEVNSYHSGTSTGHSRLMVWCSVDNGLTWKRQILGIVNERSGDNDTKLSVNVDDNDYSVGIALWYGDGAFHLAANGYRSYYISPQSATRDFAIHLSTMRLWQD